MKRAVLLATSLGLVATACGGTFYGHVPLGWRGTIPTCEGAEVSRGDALHRESTGYLTADHEGRVTLRCKNGESTDLGVKRAAKLAIEGEAQLSAGDHSGYWLRAYDASGEELRWAEPSGDIFGWSTSWPSPDADIQPAYCHEPIFGCPSADFARLTARKPGTVTLRATFGGLVAERPIVVAPR